MEVSDNGAYLATGEMATLGTRVLVVCWDTSTWNIVGSHQTHHAKVEALAISPDNSKVMLQCKDYLSPNHGNIDDILGRS